MKYLALLVLLLMGCAPHTQQLHPFPTRTVPDTRRIEYVMASEEARDSLETMWNRAVSEKVEEGICVYGKMLSTDTLLIQSALPPIEKSMQSATTIRFICDITSQYIGTVHTHFFNISEPSDLDFHSFYYSDDVLFGVMFDVNKVVLVSRELEKAMWIW